MEAEPGEYTGDWGPSSPLWSTRPALASELLPKTLAGMFWMHLDAFLEIFNTLYAVNVMGGVEVQPADATKKLEASESKKASTSAGAISHTAVSSREGRCEGSWEGEGCGGR